MDRAQRFALLGLLLGCGAAMVLVGAIAMLSGLTFVFPSLGPSAILLFLQPDAETSRPRVVLAGHAIGLACGYGSLAVTGLLAAGPALSSGVDPARVVAVALSLSATAVLMVVFRVVHAPAGATTLIVSLSLISTPTGLAVMLAAVVVLVGFARVARALGARVAPPAGEGGA